MSDSENEVRKSSNAFRTIGEVATDLGLPPHVLRFWESKFNQIKPQKRRGGHRYYRPEDIDTIKEIKALLYERGFTIKGAQKHLKNKKKGLVSDGEFALDSEKIDSAEILQALAKPQAKNDSVVANDDGSNIVHIDSVRKILSQLVEVRDLLLQNS